MIPRCDELGVHLNITIKKIETLKHQSEAKISDKDCLTDLCDHWFNNAENRTWSVVCTALNRLGKKELSLHLSDTMKEDSTGDVKYM